ncbi:MAG: outer membrane beta-barrel domain-containing protein [Bdellovibrionaceae bacterium]|nr:outer membrane beta-barrel domain-containing protein [Pseudobdellovibrionaceae bacterium]
MKFFMIVFSLLVITELSIAKDLTKNVNSLGADPAILKRAKALDPNNRVRVVQNRSVDRNWRVELGANYAMVEGGNPFLNASAVGGLAELHITPRFSLGVRYATFDNKLNSEAENRFEIGKKNPQARDNIVPEIDSPYDSTHGVISWYPVYGKINWLDMGISQFDIYLLTGYGQMNLKSGSSDSWTFGGGLGVWINQHITSRIEVRHQAYQDLVTSGYRNMDMTLLTVSLGVLL